MDELALHNFTGDNLARPSSPDNLHALLEDVENFIPGSNERTNSLEQLRSALVDRSSVLRPKAMGDHDLSRSGARTRVGTGASSFLHGGVSPDDGHMLDDLYGESTGGMSSIPEHSGTDGLWGPTGSHYVSTSVFVALEPSLGPVSQDGSEYDDIEGTFQMDDIGDTLPPAIPTTYSHLHSRATTTISSSSTKQPASTSIQTHSAGTTAARIIGGPHVNRALPGSQSSTAAAILQDVGFAAVAAGAPGAAGVLSGNLNIGDLLLFVRFDVEPRIGKSAPSAAVRSPVARPPSKTNVQMSNLAREEQAAIPHVSADVILLGVRIILPEPDKRLSHKEVEQRRREKAKQYFDELRGLLPYGGDSAKFDKNAILHHSIALIKQLLSERQQCPTCANCKEKIPNRYHCKFDLVPAGRASVQLCEKSHFGSFRAFLMVGTCSGRVQYRLEHCAAKRQSSLLPSGCKSQPLAPGRGKYREAEGGEGREGKGRASPGEAKLMCQGCWRMKQNQHALVGREQDKDDGKF
eukprot:746989-Hanusia_phi.AAC.2